MSTAAVPERPTPHQVDQARLFLTHPHVYFLRYPFAEYEELRLTSMAICRADLQARRAPVSLLRQRCEPGDAA